MRAGARVYFTNILFKNKLIFTIFYFQLFFELFFELFFWTFSNVLKIPFIWNAVKSSQLFSQKIVMYHQEFFPNSNFFQLYSFLYSFWNQILVLIFTFDFHFWFSLFWFFDFNFWFFDFNFWFSIFTFDFHFWFLIFTFGFRF